MSQNLGFDISVQPKAKNEVGNTVRVEPTTWKIEIVTITRCQCTGAGATSEVYVSLVDFKAEGATVIL